MSNNDNASTPETTAAAASSPDVVASNKTSPTRGRRLALIAAAVAVGLASYGAWWAVYERHHESTDDAYVSGDLVEVTSEVAGTVTSLKVDDTQSVTRDQALVELDPADARIAMDNAEANLARAVRQVRTQFAQTAALRAQIAERTTVLTRAQDDFHRRAGLTSDGAVSSEELSHSRDTIAQLQAGLTSAREDLNATAAQIDGTTAQNNPQVLAAEAAVRNAALALHRTRIAAPVAGVIARREVQVGQRIAPGTPLMAVVPLDSVWVDANFKEVQLADMRVGQPVSLHADVYGSNATYHGRIAGMGAGSGNAFALLPAQNASGNWIKIVQRVPVRIALDPAELKAHPLRVGLSMSAQVDVSDTRGSLVANEVRGPQPAQASLGGDPAVEARIAQIISDNDGAAPRHVALAGAHP